MSAIELFHQDGKPAGIWYCSECRSLYATEAAAIGCYGILLCACGKPVVPGCYRTQCTECDLAASTEKCREREAERFASATKIAGADYDGPVFAEGYGPEWFETLAEYLEALEYDEEQSAPYLWAANDVGIQAATTADITESILDGMWEDADESDLNGINELQAALDAFNAANESVQVWNVDYSRAIVLRVGQI